jgi:transcriptional regulator with XRE-family HTH domain
MPAFSQEELEERAGVHWSYLSDLERGTQSPALDLLNRIARALGVTLAEFFGPFNKPCALRFGNRAAINAVKGRFQSVFGATAVRRQQSTFRS